MPPYPPRLAATETGPPRAEMRYITYSERPGLIVVPPSSVRPPRGGVERVIGSDSQRPADNRRPPESVPVAVMVRVLTSVSLSPCRHTVGLSPDVDKHPLLLMAPLPPTIDAARALLPEVEIVSPRTPTPATFVIGSGSQDAK
jgi:hypothetical protein